jgi:hypothetical protein
VFVDNEYVGTLDSTSTATTDSYSRVMIYLLKTGYDGVLEIDNIFYGHVDEGSALPADDENA